MAKFSVKVKRTELYVGLAEVNAASLREAELKAKDILETQGWSGLFDEDADDNLRSCVFEVVRRSPPVAGDDLTCNSCGFNFEYEEDDTGEIREGYAVCPKCETTLIRPID